VELSAGDAEAGGIAEGDLVDVVSPRGRVRAEARITASRPGVVFVPFHYGYWDTADDGETHDRAANELTITEWDPSSKQPLYKSGACRIERVAAGEGAAAAPTTAASRPLASLSPTAGGQAAMAREEVAP
jgi:anaerobic selenocysteine-containing dehydrogenase